MLFVGLALYGDTHHIPDIVSAVLELAAAFTMAEHASPDHMQKRPDHMQERADTNIRILSSEPQDGLSTVSTHLTTDTLVLKIVESLRSQLVKSTPSVRNGLEMKHILLLLVKDFHDLCERMAFEKTQWLQKIQETIGQEGSTPKTVREQTGRIIVEKLHAAPWGHVQRPEQDRSDTVRTILAMYKAMVEFINTLTAGLEQKAEQGVDLKKYDVEEMQSEGEEEQTDKTPPDTTRPAAPKIIIHPPKRTLKSNSSSPPPSTRAAKASLLSRSKSVIRGSGNFNHGLLTTWTIAEWVHLLSIFQANPTEMDKDIAQMHNDGYWVPKGRDVKRSTDSVRQQYKKLMGKGAKAQTIRNIPEKIAELEGGKVKSMDIGVEEDVEHADEQKGWQGDEEED